MIRERSDVTWKGAEAAVENALEIIKETLEQSSEVMISAFGKWSALTKKQRRGRNPNTGEALTIEGRKVVMFKSLQALEKTVWAE